MTDKQEDAKVTRAGQIKGGRSGATPEIDSGGASKGAKDANERLEAQKRRK